MPQRYEIDADGVTIWVSCQQGPVMVLRGEMVTIAQDDAAGRGRFVDAASGAVLPHTIDKHGAMCFTADRDNMMVDVQYVPTNLTPISRESPPPPKENPV